MSWRLARSLEQLRDEVNKQFPRRSKASDGTIGNKAHAALGSKSDHNPWIRDAKGVGVVTAIDLTDDDASGADMAKLADYLLRARDPRIKYIIHNRRIASSYPSGGTPAWSWRPYSGVNAHKQHMHVSVNREARHYDDDDPWGVAKAYAPQRPLVRGFLRRGSDGPDVGDVQRALIKAEFLPKGADDNDFGPKTEAAVKRAQRAKKLDDDGIVGPDFCRAYGLRWVKD